MVASSRDMCPFREGVTRAFSGSVADAFLNRLVQLVLQALRRLQHGARDYDAPPSLLDHLPGDAVLLVDEDGVIVKLGRNVGRVLGWTDALPLGTTVLDHLHPDDHDAARHAWTGPRPAVA